MKIPFDLRDRELKRLVSMAIPSTGFLRDYVDYAETLTDAPRIFHLFSGLSAMAGAVRRRAWVQGFGGRPLYPNLWAVLLAPSSVFRKTTALNISRDLMADSGVPILPEDFSREMLVEVLAGTPQGSFVWSEFGSAIAQFDREYMSGIKDMLADMYDCPSSYRRLLKSGAFEVENPCISILGATNIDWMVDKQNTKNDLRGGFLARCLFVPYHSKDFEMETPGIVDNAWRGRLTGFLRDLQELHPVEFQISELSDLRRQLKEELDATAKQSEYLIELSAAFTRYQAVALKLGTLYAISLGEWGGEIPLEAMECAVNAVRLLKTSILDILGNVPMNRDDKILIEVINKMQQLHAAGNVWISFRDLLRYTHRKKGDLLPVLDSLVEMGKIRNHGKEYQLVI